MISAKTVLASIKKLKNRMTCDEYLKYKNNDDVIASLLAKYINDELDKRQKIFKQKFKGGQYAKQNDLERQKNKISKR